MDTPEVQKQEARILSESGPLKTELGGCALGDSLTRINRRIACITQHGCARKNAHERSRTRNGLSADGGAPGFHDRTFQAFCPFGSHGNNVKSLYSKVNPLRQSNLLSLHADIELTNPTITRRRNVLSLFQAYAEKALAAGAAPKGLEQAFAASLQIAPSMWSQIKSARPIGDKLARQIEVLSGKPRGWIDQSHEAAALTPAERAFLELSLRAWRATNSAGRRSLRAYLSAIADRAAPPDRDPRAASGAGL